MHDPAQIARLAEGLTKAQQNVLLAGVVATAWHPFPDFAFRGADGLCHWTPLGKSLAAHLTTAAQEKKDG